MKSKRITILGLIVWMTFICAVPFTIAQVNDPQLIQLGKELFFDTSLSHPDGQACSSCHSPKTAFSDPLRIVPTSQGATRLVFGSRNAPTISYAQFSPLLHWDPTMRPGIMEGMYVGGLFWDGRVNTLEEQARNPLFDSLEMHNPNPNAVLVAIRQSSYASLFLQVFGANALNDADTALQCATLAIAAYERSSEVNPFSSKFDYYLDGLVQLTDAEARGLALFTGKARCVNCHSMDNPDPQRYPGLKPLFTNFGHQNTGVPANPQNLYYKLPPKSNPDGKNFVDLGLGAVLNDPMQNGKFKIPSLRNVAATPPYMHNGVFETLYQVILFNNTRDVADWPPPEVPENVHRHMPPMPGTFGQLGLKYYEINDIVAFLKTLTDGYQIP